MLLTTAITVTEISTIITTLGFPIVMCGAMAWYVKYISDKHDQEMKTVTDALNNNTLAIQKLCLKLGEDDVA